MKKLVSTLAILTVALASGFTLTACGDDDDTTPVVTPPAGGGGAGGTTTKVGGTSNAGRAGEGGA